MAQKAVKVSFDPRLQQWLIEYVYADVKKALQLIEEESPEDPEDDPHRSLMAARGLLMVVQEAIDGCPEELQALEQFSIVTAAVSLLLGTNYIATEETAEGAKALECSHKLLSTGECKKLAGIPTITLLNQLGCVYSEREDFEGSLKLLKEAKELYISCGDHKAQLTVEEWLGGSAKWEDRVMNLEDLHTHTLFYLAQVYGSLNNKQLSAEYCLSTLARQLVSGQFDPLEWCTNAATISHCFQDDDNFPQAKHCLAACNAVLAITRKKLRESGGEDDEEVLERVNKMEANVSRSWVKYGLALLQRSLNEDGFRPLGHVPKLVRFQSLKIDDSVVTSDLVFHYKFATPVFLFCQKHVKQAQEFFTKEAYASDHVALVLDHSKLFRLLSDYQIDLAIQCRMHKRRIDMLLALKADLNPKYFTHALKKITCELGDIYKVMSDIKMKIAGDRPSQPMAIKINKLLLSGIDQCNHFISLYSDSDGKLPESFPKEDVDAVLTTHINKARMLTGVIVPCELEVKNTEQAIAIYKWVMAYYDKHKDEISASMKETIEFSREMVDLQEQKVMLLKN